MKYSTLLNIHISLNIKKNQDFLIDNLYFFFNKYSCKKYYLNEIYLYNNLRYLYNIFINKKKLAT